MTLHMKLGPQQAGSKPCLAAVLAVVGLAQLHGLTSICDLHACAHLLRQPPQLQVIVTAVTAHAVSIAKSRAIGVQINVDLRSGECWKHCWLEPVALIQIEPSVKCIQKCTLKPCLL